MLRVPSDDIDLVIQGVRDWDYKPVLEADQEQEQEQDRQG
jgi:CPA2 family monovalent cation:H+ antiporter-2